MEKLEPSYIAGGAENEVATLETTLEVPKNIKHRATIWPNNSLSRYTPLMIPRKKNAPTQPQFLLLYAHNTDHFCHPNRCDDFSAPGSKELILHQTPAVSFDSIQFNADTVYLEMTPGSIGWGFSPKITFWPLTSDTKGKPQFMICPLLAGSKSGFAQLPPQDWLICSGGSQDGGETFIYVY